MIRRLAALMFVGLLVSSLFGCGTYVARIENRSYASSADYYRGVVTDFKILTFDADLASVLCYITIVCPVFVLASIPLDLVVDTLNIPYDYARADRKEEMTAAQARMEPNHGYIKFDFIESSNLPSSAGSVQYWVTYKNNTKKAIRLYVDGAPIVDASVAAYIPTFKGYLPSSIWMFYGGGYKSLDIKFSFSNAAPLSIANGSKVNDGVYPNNNVFVFYEGRRGAEGKESIVSILPVIKHPNVWFSIDAGWSASGHTY
ncbi:TPA: YceK/YidQ family lipoprotein [Pseudomonas putida]|nr:YceK/YidQ family lipoprotein [Pseudomonas putida]